MSIHSYSHKFISLQLLNIYLESYTFSQSAIKDLNGTLWPGKVFQDFKPIPTLGNGMIGLIQNVEGLLLRDRLS